MRRILVDRARQKKSRKGGGGLHRADLREELDFPFSLGQFRLMPYVVGRYTGYSDSPGGGSKNR